MNARIFVVESNGKDLSEARERGEMTIMLAGDEGPIAARKSLIKHLQGFQPKSDKLLLIGSPIHIGIAMHIILTFHKECTCLVWDRNEQTYREEVV